MNKMDTFVVTLPCEASRLIELRRRFATWLETSSLPDDLTDLVVLATHEAAANPIQHATSCESVTVAAKVDHETLIVEVTAASPDWKANSNYPEDALGMTLIRGIIPQVEIHARANETVVRMLHPLPGSANVETT
jgi:anti-sigma regulatory factor (Ser/Thr protein kinase)